MPEEHFDVMSYYENGTQDQQDKHERWVKLLDDMYDKKLNRIGMGHLQCVLHRSRRHEASFLWSKLVAAQPCEAEGAVDTCNACCTGAAMKRRMIVPSCGC